MPSDFVGVGSNPARRRQPGCFIIDGANWFGVASVPCHDEHAVANVRGADGRSGDAVPPRIVPERGQVSENVTEPQ